MYCARQERVTVIEAIPYTNFKEKIKIQKQLKREKKRFSDLGGVLFTYNKEVAI